MADDIRTRARAWIDANVPVGAAIYSDGSTAQKFHQLTGLTQQALEKFWKEHAGVISPGQQRAVLTSCNSFTGVYSLAMGLPYLGVFPLQEKLKKLNKEEAWIPSSPNARPKYGDIVRHKAFHVDVSLDSDGDIWYSVDGGQGGPRYDRKDGSYLGGHDLVKRVTHDPYKGDAIVGWVDIEIFVALGSPQGTSDSGRTGSLWLNGDGETVNPNAPKGGGGSGFFRTAGALTSLDGLPNLPHPSSPSTRYLDPLDLLSAPSPDRKADT
jgi:hypothetical protein